MSNRHNVLTKHVEILLWISEVSNILKPAQHHKCVVQETEHQAKTEYISYTAC